MADIKDRNLRKRSQRLCRISTLKSSNVPIGSADLWSCPNAGSSNAPSLGSIAAEGSPRIGRISTERRSRSCASPQSASCSENSAIQPEVSGRTLRATRITVGVADRSIDVLIFRLRRKLSAVAPEDSIISTERGAGYRFAMPVRRHSLHPADVQTSKTANVKRFA